MEKKNQLGLLLDKEKRDSDSISSNLNRLRNDRSQEQARWEEERKNTMKLLTVANEKLSSLTNESNRLTRENQQLMSDASRHTQVREICVDGTRWCGTRCATFTTDEKKKLHA